ncbi:hypothetical protein RB195_025316 [Necator americanus]|uniref:Reverse transcriptase domain-containing protein n=1 Tax=Necator americanus TaxID=51031 RepID=A0ABR1ERS5_NECAM
MKEDLKERRVEVLAQAAETGQSIHDARRNFANRKTTMTALRTPNGTTTASRREMEKVIREFYSLRQWRPLASSPSEERWTYRSNGPPFRNPTCHHVGEESYFTRPRQHIGEALHSLSVECKVPKQWRTSKTVLLYKKGDPQDIGNYIPIRLLPVTTSSSQECLTSIDLKKAFDTAETSSWKP